MAQHKLVIAEKPSVAQSLAAVIGATVRKDGYLEGIKYTKGVKKSMLILHIKCKFKIVNSW